MAGNDMTGQVSCHHSDGAQTISNYSNNKLTFTIIVVLNYLLYEIKKCPHVDQNTNVAFDSSAHKYH